MSVTRYHFTIEGQELYFSNPFVLSPRIPLHIYRNDENVTRKLTGSNLLTRRTITILNKYLTKFPFDEENLIRLLKLKKKPPSKQRRDDKRKRCLGDDTPVLNNKDKSENQHLETYNAVPPPSCVEVEQSKKRAMPLSSAISKYFEFSQCKVANEFTLVYNPSRKPIPPIDKRHFTKESYSKHFIKGETINLNNKVSKDIDLEISVYYDSLLPLEKWQKLYNREKNIKMNDKYIKSSSYKKMTIDNELIHYANGLMSIPEPKKTVSKEIPSVRKPPAINKVNRTYNYKLQPIGYQLPRGDCYNWTGNNRQQRTGTYRQRQQTGVYRHQTGTNRQTGFDRHYHQTGYNRQEKQTYRQDRNYRPYSPRSAT